MEITQSELICKKLDDHKFEMLLRFSLLQLISGNKQEPILQCKKCKERFTQKEIKLRLLDIKLFL